jgi:hypothetical protein
MSSEPFWEHIVGIATILHPCGTRLRTVTGSRSQGAQAFARSTCCSAIRTRCGAASLA